MTTIRNLISIWMLTLTGSLLLPMASFATVSGTTHDLPSVSTTMQVSLPTCTTVGEEQYAAVGLRSMASHQVWSLFGVSRILNAPKNADDLLQQSRKYLGDGDLIIEKPLSGSDLIIRTQDRSKQIRFDLSDPHGLDPHVNVEAWKPRNKFPGDRKMLPDPDVVSDGNLHLFPEAK